MSSRIVVAMSGGVDSSVAAALLVREGYEVIGVTLQIWPEGMRPPGRHTGCCSLDAVDDARRVADRLGIDYYVFNFQGDFARQVIEPFTRAYLRGRTPNPCVWCNERIKFGALLDRALELGAEAVATGHYAAVERDPRSGRWVLKRPRDRRKDQSYSLWPLTQHQLAHALFPLASYTKQEVREMAARLGLPVAQKAESQEICFIPDDDYRRFMREVAPESVAPGPIVDVSGRVLGEHSGVAFYTVGQRRGLGLASGRPLYVVAIDPERRAVVVGDREQAHFAGLVATGVNWVAWPDLQGRRPVLAKIRRSAEEVPAVVEPLAEEASSGSGTGGVAWGEPAEGADARPGGTGRVRTWFETPQWAVTPGQSVVWYDGDRVAGGAVIEAGITTTPQVAHTSPGRA